MRDSRIVGKLYVGTSGWSYKYWRGVFYPEDMAQKKWLEFYAKHFSTVEINNSFYRLPKRETFISWKNKTPPGFVFAVKASRYITHVKKLKDVNEAWSKFFDNALGLEQKLGPILFQFPANWHANSKRLAEFLLLLPDGYRYAFEFRDQSWFNSEIYSLLRKKKAALCIADSPQWPTVFEITAPFTFIRMHGGRILYASDYSAKELSDWAQKVADYLNRRLDVYIYFNNDAFGYAVKNAREFNLMVLSRLFSP